MVDARLPIEPATEPERAVVLGRLGALDVADLCLMMLAASDASAVTIEPTKQRHVIRVERGGEARTVASLESSLADAVVARLAFIAGLPLGTRENQLGRVRLRVARSSATGQSPVTDLLLYVRSTENGLAAEAHRIGTRLVSGAANGDAVTNFESASGRLGPYRLLGELGRGGMGVVFRAEHVALQKLVAIKVLHPEVARDPLIAAQFLVEARAACRAKDPGIVDVTDYGTLSDGRAFIVMELVDAPTLATLLQEGALEVGRALALGLRIAEALRAAASQGVVHRDLTPSNIFVDREDRVKIGDFGLARILDSKEPVSERLGQRAIMGTAVYMSPEQGRGDAADVRSDIYSFGCVLYRMLTGRVPFSGSTLVDIIAQHTLNPIPELVGPTGPVPEQAARVVHRAMAKRAEERYQNVDELIADIEAALRVLGRSDWRRWLPR